LVRNIKLLIVKKHFFKTKGFVFGAIKKIKLLPESSCKATDKKHVCLQCYLCFEQRALKVSQHAEKTLDSFCRWAKRMNPRS